MPTQVCPPLDSAPQAAASAAASRSASAATMSASLPPHSATRGVRFWAQAAITFFAVAAEPVNPLLLTALRAPERGEPPAVPDGVGFPGEQPGPPVLRRQARPPGGGLVRTLDRLGHLVLAEDREGGDDLRGRRIQRVEGRSGPRRALRSQRRDHRRAPPFCAASAPAGRPCRVSYCRRRRVPVNHRA